MMKHYSEADKRLKRMFQEVWDTLIDDVTVQKLMCKLTPTFIRNSCGTLFKHCEMRVDNPPYLNDCLCDQAVTLKAYLLMQKKGYIFFPIGCLRLAIGTAGKIKDTQWTDRQKEIMRKELYGKED